MAPKAIEFAVRGRDEAAKEVANVTASVEKLSTALNGLATKAQAPIIHASQMPQVRALEGETVRLTQNLQALGSVGTRALTPLEQEAARLAATISSVGRGVFQSNEQFHKFLGQVRGFSPEKIVEFERRVAELLPRAFGKSEAAAIRAADSFKSLDAVADKIARREFRAELFSRALKLGDRGTPILGQINAKKTTQELEAVERQILKIETASKRGAVAATKHKMSLHDVAKSAGGALEKAIGQRFGGAGGALLGGLVGGAVGAAAIEGVQRLEKAITGLVSATADLALEQRKVTVDAIETGLSVESLETMRHASEVTGIEVASLSMGMRRLADNITEKAPAFEALGIATKDASGELRSTDDVMRDLFDVFKHTTNETQRMQLASELFGGRMGTRLIPLLVQGREGFEALTEQGRRFGVILSHDAEAALVAHANQISTTKEAWRGLKNELKVEVLPVFGLLDKASGLLAAKLRFDARNVASTFEMATLLLQGPGIRLRGPRPTVTPRADRPATEDQEHDMMNRVTRALKLLKEPVEDNTKAVDALFASVGRLARTDRFIDGMAASFMRTREEIELMIKPLAEGGKGLEQSVIQKIIDRAPFVQAAIRKWGESWRFVLDVAGEAARRFDAVPDKIAAIDRAMANLGRSSMEMRDEIVDAAQRFESLLRVTDRRTAAETLFENLGRDAAKFSATMVEVEARAERLRESLSKLPRLPEITPEFGPEQENMLNRMLGTLAVLRGPDSIQPIKDLFEGVPKAWNEAADRLLKITDKVARAEAIESLRPLLSDRKTSRETKSIIGGLIVRKDIEEFQDSLRTVLNMYNAFSSSIAVVSQGIYDSFRAVFMRLRDETQTIDSAVQTIVDGMVAAVLAKLSELAAAGFLRFVTTLLTAVFGGGGGISPRMGDTGFTYPVGGASTKSLAPVTNNITNVYAWDVRDGMMQRMSPAGGLRRSGERVRIVRTY